MNKGTDIALEKTKTALVDVGNAVARGGSKVWRETAEGALIINQKFKKVDEKIIDSVRMLGYRILIQKSYIKRVSKLKTLLQRSTHNPMGADSINKGYN
jgi:hypothetical protein